MALALGTSSIARAEVELPRPDESQAISFGADSASSWDQGAYEVWLLRGNCYVQQGETKARSDEAVLWIKRSGEFSNRQNLVITYLEGNVKIDYRRAGFPYTLNDNAWLGEFFSIASVDARVTSSGGEPNPKPQVYNNAVTRRNPGGAQAIRRTQFSLAEPSQVAAEAVPAGSRRLRARPRSDVPLQAQWFPSPDGSEWVAVITSGVTLLIDGVGDSGTISVSTDRMVLWIKGNQQPDLTGQTVTGGNTPLELYMEGNIVFLEGDRIIRATRMYYDVNSRVGTVLDANMLTPVPTYRGLLRLKADVVQQTGPDHFSANNAYITSSRLADPSYRLQTGELTFDDLKRPLFERDTGAPIVNPVTGEQMFDHEQLLTSKQNKVYLGPVPVLYWPTMATDLKNPSYYVRRARVRNDQVFGTQILADLDMYQILGIRNKPAGTDFTASVDYMSLRGLGHGLNLLYDRTDVFGYGGAARGILDYWGIEDHGLDRLGQGRMAIPPEKNYRWRLYGRHRQTVLNDWQLTGELGWISDRNFLEQYFERDWDTQKDETTGVELKRLVDNMSYSITSDVRVNSFFTQTEWLPRGDHFWLGQDLFDRFTWFEHSSIGYGRVKVNTLPEDPQQRAMTVLEPWMVNSSGERVATRQEIDLPFELAYTKFVPYALGELAHWGQVIDGGDEQRAYGQVGIRASTPFWSVNPTVENQLFNLHGLAHKIVFDVDAFYSDSNRNVTDFPLYDPIQDDAQEAFQERFPFSTFGTGVIPPQFYDVNYAVRSDLQRNVTSSSTEIADDLTAMHLGARQRWQTKRGRLDQRRIIDWITLDAGTMLYANPNDMDFGQVVGLTNYDFRWHVGDRLTVLSGGSFDYFNQGQSTISLGATLSRPPRGSWYAGLLSIGGPIDYHILTTSYTYRLSPKWMAGAGTSINLNGFDAIGNNLVLSRIGESLLASFGFTFDKFKNNVGVNLMLEPRFLPKQRFTNVPIAGLQGLE